MDIFVWFPTFHFEITVVAMLCKQQTNKIDYLTLVYRINMKSVMNIYTESKPLILMAVMVRQNRQTYEESMVLREENVSSI